MIIDNTPPVLNTATTKDIDLDGLIDRIDVTFTEATGMENSVTPSNDGWTITADGAEVLVVVSSSWNGQTLELVVTEQSTVTTEDTPSVAYNQATGASDVQDLASNELATGSVANATDGAAPAPISAVYQDNSANGTVDRIVVTLSENVADINYTYDAGDWSFTNNGDLSLAVNSSIAMPGGGNTITLGVSATANVTGHTTTPQVVFTATTGVLSDGTNPQA